MEKKDSKFCQCLYHSANALGRVMSRMAEEEFSLAGLSPSYAFLLMSVNEKPGIQPKEISREMQLTPSTVTRFIEKMEHRGFVERRINGRNTEVFPTEKSLQLDQNIRDAWNNLYKRYTTLLGEDAAKQLTTDVYEASKTLDE